MNLGGVEFGTLDLVMGAVLLVSALVGLWRGLTFEVLSLLGWVAAYVAAQWFAPEVAPLLPIGSEGSALNFAAAFALVFVASLFVWALVARLVRALLHASPLQPVDRALGVLFGLLRGVVLLLVVVTLVAMTPAREGAEWQRSQIARGLEQVLFGLKPLLPAGVAQHLPVRG